MKDDIACVSPLGTSCDVCFDIEKRGSGMWWMARRASFARPYLGGEEVRADLVAHALFSRLVVAAKSETESKF